MKTSRFSALAGFGVFAAACFFVLASAEAAPPTPAKSTPAQTLFNEGNFKEAYQNLQRSILDPQNTSRQVGADLGLAQQCLKRLNRTEELDALLEEAAAVHKGHWRPLWKIATCYLGSDRHYGFMVAGKFHRGDHRGGGKAVNAAERDRVRMLQLMTQALPLAMKDEHRDEAGEFLQSFAEMLLENRGYGESWRLQYLTDIKTLPDYEEGYGVYDGGETPGAPVDADGKPVFYSVPKTFAAAENDGQRWRWCLRQAVELDPELLNSVRLEFAQFLDDQFGVQTMDESGWPFGREAIDDTKEDESGTYALHTLKDTETIARLAGGIKRFDLPDEFNYIKIYEQIAAKPEADGSGDAIEGLANIFENRRQYDKVAEYLRRLLKVFSPSHPYYKRWQEQLDQIVGNWGRFEPAETQPAGKGAAVDYRFRNGTEVEFTAQAVKVEKLLADVKAFLKSRPASVDQETINIQDIGHRLVTQNETQYVGDMVAQWKMPLAPRENHFDRRTTVATPMKTPGAYLVTAKMKGGNTSKIVVWIDDTAIVKKPLDGKMYYYVADATSGKPIAKAHLDFFGWRQNWRNQRPQHEILYREFAKHTDADGQAIIELRQRDKEHNDDNYQWLITAKTKEGRFAYLGFTGVWYGGRNDKEYNATKVFTITDRPVYRPEQKVKYKFWVRHAKYDMEDASDFAGKEFTVDLFNPKEEKIVLGTLKADAWGGIEGEYTIPADANLGVYSLKIGELGNDGNDEYGGNTFRVEEYKKPEYEVSVDAPEKPVTLGDKITATIRAKYYFGSPVTRAKVKYKVNRETYDEPWYPCGAWDWLYGSGYWWYAYDYCWYPGWHHWGCSRPMPFWWPHEQQPPELVADREVEIGEDGTVKVEIDTGLAKALHPDCDHSYTITAEVVDDSRHTIVGAGRVLVARRPFTVTAWLDRGYYRTGDTIAAHFSARTLDGKPVEGTGKLQLLKISYKADKNGNLKPVEMPVNTWDVNTNAEGIADQQMTASEAGQYRVSYKLVASGQWSVAGKSEIKNLKSELSNPKSPISNPSIEGGYVFTVIGAGFTGAQFRFNHLELIPDRREYAPGDKVKLQINTDRAGGVVLLFLRPANGVYLPPEIIRLDGKSTIREIGVVKKDMPNFFVEAVTVADGRVHTETKEIVVPPEKRILNVEIQPSKDAYKPGEKAEVKIKLTDFSGEAFVGSTVVAIYDKSLEYISGGSNVPEIKEFFWKWHRHHYPETETSLDRWCGNLVSPNATAMSDLGVFGGAVAEEMDKFDEQRRTGDRSEKAGRATLGGFGMGGMGGGMGGMGGGMDLPKEAKTSTTSTPAAREPSGLGGKSAGAPMVEPTVRKNFADTALWVGALTTAADGTAEVSLAMPENLTTWRIEVWGMGQGTRVGQGFCDVVTRKDLIIRLQAPRFFVQSDEVVLSAVVHNYLKSKKSVKVALELDGKCLGLSKIPFVRFPDGSEARGVGQDIAQYIEIAPNGEARVDWRVEVLEEGQATICMKAITDEESDAMEEKFTCYIHGMAKMDSYCGVIRPSDESGKFTVHVPKERRPGQSRLEVRFSPTLAGAMVDALPYMVDYPYGCTEQTLNRFLPTVITQKVLLDMKLDLQEIQKKQTNLNAQEIGDDRQRAKQWERLDKHSPHPNPLLKGKGTGGSLAKGEGTKNPVFDEEEVRRMVKDGVERLTAMQCSDGGWGWFSGWGENPQPHTTAVVVHGLQIAKANDVAIVSGVLERGVDWLKRYQDRRVQFIKNAEPKDPRWTNHDDHMNAFIYADNMDAFVYMVLVDAGVTNADMRDLLYRYRTHLTVYSMAMYGLALETQGEKEKLAMILRNIGQYVQQDDENQTAWLRLPEGFSWWYWYGSEFEADAYYLKLLARTDPKGERARRLVKYLLNNRKNASYWISTRDTSLCIEAMADFIRASGEDRPNMTVEVFYDGRLQKAVGITPKNLFQFDNKFVLEGAAVEAGRHTIELRKKGLGPLYYNGTMSYFTLEDFIPKSTSVEVKVDRKYYKLVKADKSVHVAGSHGQAALQKVEKYVRQELPNLADVKSGDLVEIELAVDSKNDYEYLIFEDMKPAGFEPVDLRSGYNGNDMGAYVEFRDNRVVFFVHVLARGRHSVAYRMRAETPGRFSALPTRVWAMYAPELKANSDEMKIGIRD